MEPGGGRAACEGHNLLQALCVFVHHINPLPPSTPTCCLLLQSEMLEGNTAGALALPTATLTMLRLTRDEVGFRPMAVAGELQVGWHGWVGRWLGCWHAWLYTCTPDAQAADLQNSQLAQH